MSTLENHCYAEITNFDGNLIAGSKSLTVIDKYKFTRGDWGASITLSDQSMVTINEVNTFCNDNISVSLGKALIKINTILNNMNNKLTTNGDVYFELANTELPTSKDLASKLINQSGSIAKFGEAPVYIEAGDCTGEGNIPNDWGGTEIPDSPQSLTYAFEDNYPAPGDYDFNDIVMDVETSINRNSSNQIQSYTYKVTLTAVGATKKLGAGLRLADINRTDVQSVTFVDTNNMRSTLAGSAFENSNMETGNEVVIPLFGDAHAALGANTTQRPMLNTGLNSATANTLEVTVTPSNQTLTEPAITKDNLDFFIAYQAGSEKRTEIHIHEFAVNHGATANGTVHPQNLEAAGKHTWGICVPSFNYPKESVSIEKAYPKFAGWANDCSTNLDWYNHPEKEKISR